MLGSKGLCFLAVLEVGRKSVDRVTNNITTNRIFASGISRSAAGDKAVLKAVVSNDAAVPLQPHRL